jgi:aminopeptidase N
LFIRSFEITASIRPVKLEYEFSGGFRFTSRGALRGTTSAILEVTASGPIATARFSFDRELKLLSVRATGYQVTPDRRRDTLSLTFSPSLQPGSKVPLIFDYEGQPLYIYDEFVLLEEGTLYPVLISPFGDYSVNLARVALKLEVPSGYTVVAPGKLLSQNGGTISWDTEVPVPWVAVAGGRKHTTREKTIQGISMQFHVPPGEDRNLDKLSEFAGKAVGFYSNLLYPFPYSGLRVVSLFIVGGGIGYPALLLIDDRAFRNTFDGDANRDSNLFKLMAHETAHSYVPSQTVPKGVGFIWLSEAFAEYLALMATEAVLGPDAYKRELQEERDAYAKVAGTAVEPSIGAVTFANYRGAAGPVIYNKGALVLHMLRGVLGDEAFKKGLATYFTTFRGRAARLSDFQHVMEQAAGQSLEWFFQEWIQEKVLPDYSITQVKSSQTEGAFQTTATVRNLGTGRMPVEVGFIMDGAVQIERVEVPSGGDATVMATTPKTVKQVEVDPRKWLIQKSYANKVTPVK